MGKVASLQLFPFIIMFLTFPIYINGRLGTNFYSQITFGVVRKRSKWSKLPQFHKGGPSREQEEGENSKQNFRGVKL